MNSNWKIALTVMIFITAYQLMSGLCGTWMCVAVQMCVLMPLFTGNFLVFLVSLLRNFIVRGESNKNQTSIEKRHKKIIHSLFILTFAYFAIVQCIYGPDGMLYQVSFWNTAGYHKIKLYNICRISKCGRLNSNDISF